MLKPGNRVKQWDGFRKVIASSALIFLVLIIFYWGGDQTPSSTLNNPLEKLQSSSLLGFPIKKWNSFDSLVQFHPTVEFRNGTDLIWQIPKSPKAVLFIAHGCNCKASYFWDRSQACLHCVGLPEERLIVLEALYRKFAVLTISSAGRCWSMGEERIIVRDIITWWRSREKLEKLPLVALGASSGGYFVSALANDIKLNSVTLMIAEGIFDQMDVVVGYPPTLFVHMPKDRRRQHRIGRFINDLRDKGVDVAEVQCLQFPLSPNIFSDRIPGLEENVSSRLFDLFHEKGFVDENGYMKNDGRATRWKEMVKKDSTLLLDKQLFQHVQEELNLAFAYHEMTSLQSDQIFKWFESHMS